MNVIAGFIAALLSGMGLGSGGLLVIFLNLMTDYKQLTIQGINLLFFIFSSSAALIYHIFHRKISFPTVALMSGFGICGSLIGCYLSYKLKDDIVRKIFGGMLIASGSLTLLRDFFRNRKSKEKSKKKI